MIHTNRLILRPFEEADFAPFAEMNADPVVMEFFPATLTREESDQFALRLMAHFQTHGYGPWVVAIPGVTPFAGFVGLLQVNFTAHFTPAVEVGWRFARLFWGQGYATEGAAASLQFGFEQLHLSEIVSITAIQNLRSQRVMERIGMTRDPNDDFDHPKLSEGHPLRRHVLYRSFPKGKFAS